MSKAKKGKTASERNSGLTNFEILQLAATLVSAKSDSGDAKGGTGGTALLKFRIFQMLECAAWIRAELGDTELANALKEAKTEGGHLAYTEVVVNASRQANDDPQS